MKMTYFALILILTSCGNPHLIRKNKPITQLPLITDQPSLSGDFNLLKVETLLGEKELLTKITDINNSGSQIVRVFNQDPKEMEVTYQILDGSHFAFNGGNFPGTNGSCAASLESDKNCDIDLVFHADDEGVYQDKLIIIFKPKGSDLATKVIEFPLRGERKNSVVAAPLLKVAAQNGDESLNFGKTELSETISSKLIVTNVGNIPLLIDSSFEKNNSFNFEGGKYPGSEGTCNETLDINESCHLHVSFTETSKGLHSDNLVTTYKASSGKSIEMTVRTSIFGEKTPKIGTPGDLVPSEILGDSIDFGNISVGAQAAKQVEISNIGSMAVKITETTINDSKNFSFNGGKFPGTRGTCNEIVQPGNCLLDLVYKPALAGHHSGNLNIATDNGKKLTLKLSGEAKSAQACFEESEVLLSAIPKARAVAPILPYLTQSTSTSSKLQVLYGTEVNGYYSTLDMYTVKDSMVYVQYDLPELEDEVISINFGVEVQKIVLDNYKDTESLCLSTSSNVRKCSGQQFSLDSWQKLLNKRFWDKYEAPVSELYTQQFDQGKWNCGNTSCMRLKKVYNLESIFDLNSKEMQTVIRGKRVSLVFSDDTRLMKLPKLLIKTKKKVECKN
ncbi:MAG: choice-of-anchor D domain-containing protein [Bacteriovoracaceae bacterium]